MKTENYLVGTDYYLAYRELTEEEVLEIFNEAVKDGVENILKNLPKNAPVDKFIAIRQPHCKYKLSLNEKGFFEIQK